MSVRPTVKQYGKTLTFVGVLFLVVGLLQGGAGASNGGNGNGAGHEHAAGWQRNFGDEPVDTVAADAAATVSDTDCGAYCSTTDGTPSGNGNGDNGNQPCAGCVGNADNENPSGQHHDGSDDNNGYECDGNNGIAKGNPAHSVCHDPVTTTTVPQHNTTTTVAQGTTTTTVASTTTTVAAGGTTTTTAEVLGVQFTRGVDPLASTGAGFLRPFTLLGALLLLLGVALMTIKVRPLAAV